MLKQLMSMAPLGRPLPRFLNRVHRQMNHGSTIIAAPLLQGTRIAIMSAMVLGMVCVLTDWMVLGEWGTAVQMGSGLDASVLSFDLMDCTALALRVLDHRGSWPQHFTFVYIL